MWLKFDPDFLINIYMYYTGFSRSIALNSYTISTIITSICDQTFPAEECLFYYYDGLVLFTIRMMEFGCLMTAL